MSAIDGSNNGSNSRDLTLANASTTSPTVVHIGSTGTIPITNVTLKNCVSHQWRKYFNCYRHL
ncbi:MAG: hypothetical protein IPG79_17110 [Saprospiraceae bacterium]|nr:hypothetical protein [Saprospiraceae bacterium]